MTKNSGHKSAVWLSGPNIAAAEIAASIGYTAVVLDIEHGSFDLDTLERFIPVLKGLGLEVLAKVLAPERGPIQQALDFGADAVVIPHILDAAHAEKTCAFAKFPPHGERSFAGGRTVAYGSPDDQWFIDQDRKTRCYPMIEHASALRDIEHILSLDTVDGVFIGPSDLSLRRGRGSYKRSEADFADLKAIADAAKAAGKHWLLPAWSVSEKQFALENNAHTLVLTMEHGAIALGFRDAWNTTAQLLSPAH
ncbi:4-hydroxy-2-oxoheptanedioate aldolase [Rhizobium sp. BIGb0125]|jgi:4-hydroxy-2-oxoheptanedioate aldolase|uniref:aldolase/citrate lyase family protein n=1 Tax=Rhizobium/Agrobacterium group TaxID=227290 RepID=UPI0017840351|nr:MULTISPECIES: aldolase/citrate lyase family protein [Rhizobium/Agrobacterium group]MBD9387963.1 4-hydroxy-2-oxovalerate aldolase [Agrobacterium sp. AGB01]MCS4243354.1 4-hydroxy-2-oxoheptanedioate aldolase [Rhizobium sp. BIGb0125]